MEELIGLEQWTPEEPYPERPDPDTDSSSWTSSHTVESFWLAEEEPYNPARPPAEREPYLSLPLIDLM